MDFETPAISASNQIYFDGLLKIKRLLNSKVKDDVLKTIAEELVRKIPKNKFPLTCRRIIDNFKVNSLKGFPNYVDFIYEYSKLKVIDSKGFTDYRDNKKPIPLTPQEREDTQRKINEALAKSKHFNGMKITI